MPIDTELQFNQKEFSDEMWDVWRPLLEVSDEEQEPSKYRGFYLQGLQPGPEYEGWYPHGQRPKAFEVTFDTPFFIDKLVLQLLNNYPFSYDLKSWERNLGGLPKEAKNKINTSLGIEESNKWRVNKGGLVVQVPYKLVKRILMKGSLEPEGYQVVNDWCVTLNWINRRGSKNEEARDDDDYYHLNYNAGEFISVSWIICPKGINFNLGGQKIKGTPYEVSIKEEGQQLREGALSNCIVFYLGDTIEAFDKLNILSQSIFPFMNWNENPMEVK